MSVRPLPGIITSDAIGVDEDDMKVARSGRETVPSTASGSGRATVTLPGPDRCGRQASSRDFGRQGHQADRRRCYRGARVGIGLCGATGARGGHAIQVRGLSTACDTDTRSRDGHGYPGRRRRQLPDCRAAGDIYRARSHGPGRPVYRPAHTGDPDLVSAGPRGFPAIPAAVVRPGVSAMPHGVLAPTAGLGQRRIRHRAPVRHRDPLRDISLRALSGLLQLSSR